MPTVEVHFSALPAHVRTARLIATAVARRSGLDEGMLDEVRLAVGEACSRAVNQNQRHAPAEPVALTLSDEDARFTVTVSDAGPADEDTAAPDLARLDHDSLAAPEPAGADGFLPEPLPAGFGLAVITGLVDDVDVTAEPAGTSVRMSWPYAVAAGRSGGAAAGSSP